MQRIIQSDKSVVVAADVPNLRAFDSLVQAVANVEGICGMKIGFELATLGMRDVVDIAKFHLGKHFPVIYDPQTAGSGIPKMGLKFATAAKKAGVDAVILYPFAGPATQAAWTKACLYEGIEVITGFVMTHEKCLVSEGGYIADEAVPQMLHIACSLSCSNFVVPGTKLEWVERIRRWIAEELGEGCYDLYATGFIEQGGIISECGRRAGPRWHAIVGDAIYNQLTWGAMREAAMKVTSQIVATA